VPQLAALFVLVQIIEIWLLIQVGQAIGGWQTLLLLVVDSLLGAWLLRREGRRTWRAFRLALAERRLPAREVADGVLVIIGGTLLITPGFLSDVVGLLFLLPPSRSVIRPVLTRVVAGRMGVVGLGGQRRRSSYRAPTVLDGEVVDGEVVAPDSTKGRLPGENGPSGGVD
jgi:UPF0716 protein FxsA